MIHSFLANCILLLHLAFIVTAVFGGFFIFYRKWMLWLHIPMVFWAIFIEFSGWICPLTPLENHFRALAGQSGYEHGFIHHFLLRTIYPEGLTRQTQIFLGIGVLMLNALVYLFYFLKTKKQNRGSI